MNSDEAFAQILFQLGPMINRNHALSKERMPRVKNILEDLRATAHAEGYNTGYEQRGSLDGRYVDPESR